MGRKTLVVTERELRQSLGLTPKVVDVVETAFARAERLALKTLRPVVARCDEVSRKAKEAADAEEKPAD